MMSANNSCTIYYPTNQTEISILNNSDWLALQAFLEKRILAEKILFIFVSLFTVFGNTLVLVATWKERSLHQPNKYFIACLAVADLLVGMFVGPLRVYKLNLYFELGRRMPDHLFRFTVWIDTFSLLASICSLTFISFDRFLKISKPLQYKSRMTTSKSFIIIFIIWLISTAFATYAATPQSGSEGILLIYISFGGVVNGKGIVYYSILGAAFAVLTIVILIMYALIFIVVRKRRKMLRNGELGEALSCNDRNQRSAFLQDLKVIRMFLVVVGVFMFCWCPFVIFGLVDLYFLELELSFRQLLRLSIALLVVELLPLFNSLVNPIIYAWMDQTYRKAFKNLFQRMMCRTSSRRQRQSDAIELRPMRTR